MLIDDGFTLNRSVYARPSPDGLKDKTVRLKPDTTMSVAAHEHVLVVGADVMSSIVNCQDRATGAAGG